MESQSGERPVLSVLIPTRNRAGYLPFAIQSALNVPSPEIEIVVSENHSDDGSWEVCQRFSDTRLRVIRPPRPLAMHDHWEWLLSQATGQWVTFIGDDDAVMPHCVEHLKFLASRFPQAEAIVTPRAYFFWPGCEKTYGDVVVDASFKEEYSWVDSKRELRAALRGKTPYISLPQLYSGGVQRRSLINRVRMLQGGTYFRSVTPDAYSALMSCIHTYRYLRSGIPITWVGTSPDRQMSDDRAVTKDRERDFFDLLSEDSLISHPALGDLKNGTFLLCLFEAYISAFPTTSPDMLSMGNVRSMFHRCVKELRSAGREDAAQRLARDLGFSLPRNTFLKFSPRVVKLIALLQARLRKTIRRMRFAEPATVIHRVHSTSRGPFPDILSCDRRIAETYRQCVAAGHLE